MLLLLLHQHDIPSRLADEHMVAMEWTLANATGGIKVQVPIAHEFHARDIASKHKAKSKSRGTEASFANDDTLASRGKRTPQPVSAAAARLVFAV